MPSCAVLATCRPSVEKIRVIASPREPDADGDSDS